MTLATFILGLGVGVAAGYSLGRVVAEYHHQERFERFVDQGRDRHPSKRYAPPEAPHPLTRRSH